MIIFRKIDPSHPINPPGFLRTKFASDHETFTERNLNICWHPQKNVKRLPQAQHKLKLF